MTERSWPTAKTDFAPACALMFRAQALRDIGLFDESFGTCWEDYDLCMRFVDAGRSFVAVGEAEVVHDHGATTGKASPYITYYFTRNRLICLSRYGRPLGVLRCSPSILRSFWWQMKEYGLSNWACHRAFARGVADFLLGVRGEQKNARSTVDVRRRKWV
jgi:GT2 family glycosyltransferase